MKSIKKTGNADAVEILAIIAEGITYGGERINQKAEIGMLT